MIKLLSISGNTFVQTVRQPIYGIIIFLVILVLVLLQPMTGWTMGDTGGDFQKTDQYMLIQNGLCTLLVGTVILAAFAASGALRRELEDRTALTVLSKPVSRATFLLGKFAGVTGAVVTAFYLTSLVFLMIVRHQVQSSATDPSDMPVIVLGLSAFAIALLIAIGGNIFFGWAFISSSIYAMLITLTIAMSVLTFVGKDWQQVPPGYDVPPQKITNSLKVTLTDATDPETFRQFAKNKNFRVADTDIRGREVTIGIPPNATADSMIDTVRGWTSQVASVDYVYNPPVISAMLIVSLVLMLVPVLIMTAIGVAASVRWGQVLTLMACIAMLMLGLMHAWIFGDQGRRTIETAASQPAIAVPDIQTLSHKVVIVRVISPIVPKLTYFYLPTALMSDKDIPWSYVTKAIAYGLLYMAGVLALGLALFQRQSLEADSGTASMPGMVGLTAWLGRAAAVLIGLVGLEGALSFIVSRFNNSYSLVFDSLGRILSGNGEPNVAVGLLVIGGLLAASAIGWVVWTYFGRGIRWAYWVAVITAAILTGLCLWAGVKMISGTGTQAQNLIGLTAGTIIAVLILLILILPGTRRHFRKTAR